MASGDMGWSKDKIKQFSGLSGAVMSNLTGIPTDAFRVRVAQDMANKHSVIYHLKDVFSSPKAAFVGGFARITQKQIATTLNLYVPAETREAYPFASAFCVGLGFSPLLNIPRVFQLGAIGGVSYPQSFKQYFTSAAGLKSYAHNTMIYGPGEGLRMMMCFGFKDYLMPKIGGKADVHQLNSIPMHCASMASIAGPLVAAVETTFALTTETVSTIQAKQASLAAAGGEQKSFGTVLRETITPKYTGRCFVSLLFKNICANTPLFWIMFMSDFYSRKATH
jgi:hypothetical protein